MKEVEADRRAAEEELRETVSNGTLNEGEIQALVAGVPEPHSPANGSREARKTIYEQMGLTCR